MTSTTGITKTPPPPSTKLAALKEPSPEAVVVGTTAAVEEFLPFALELTSTIDNSNRIVEQHYNTDGNNRNEEEEEEEGEVKGIHACGEVLNDYAMYTDYYTVVAATKEETDLDDTIMMYYDVLDPSSTQQGRDRRSPKNAKDGTTANNNHIRRTNKHREDGVVLATLLSGNIRGEPQLQQQRNPTNNNHNNDTNDSSLIVLQECQLASQQAQLAFDYLRQSNNRDTLSLAIQSLYSSSNHYKNAAATTATTASTATITNLGGTNNRLVATSLQLLSQYYWKRAEAIRLATTHPQIACTTTNTTTNNTTPTILSSSSSHPQVEDTTSSKTSNTSINTNIITRPPSAAVVRIRDALHANPPEEDISASVFLGKNHNHKTNINQNTITTTATTTDVKKSTDNNNDNNNNPITTTINPVDDMLQLEKELHTMNMSLSMHASVANLQAATSTKSSNNNNNNQQCSNILLSQLRNAPTAGANSNLLDSSCWWGQSSFLHSHNRSDYTVSPNMASSISSWATTTSTLHSTTNTTTKPSITTVHPSQRDSTTTTSTNSSSSDNNCDLLSHHHHLLSHSSSTTIQPINNNNNAKQLLRLLDALKVLGDENAALLEQVEDANRARLEAKAAKEEMKRFQSEYQKRFHTLKAALDKLHQQQQQQHNTTTDKNFILSSELLSSKKDNTRSPNDDIIIKQAKQQVHSLQLQIQKLQQEGKKKDATLKKYENFYKEVKARSAQRAAQRSSSTDVVK